MDVISAFLYGIIEEEVYVCQPPGFEDPNFPDKVYKVEKDLYGLHQAPRAWYETLSTYLLDNGFYRGQIDKTLFIKRHKDDILLVQVYVDDVIFGSTKKELSTEFEKLMHDKFQMSSIGELPFFLGLQVKQKSDGIFISQDKYMAEVLKKFEFVNVKTASTPIESNKLLIKDEEAKDVDVHLYRSMIGSLMYLTTSRPDITFAVCACARFQVTPKTSHLHAMKRTFRYLKGQPKLGLWYPKDSPFNLEAYSDRDYAEASLDRKSTTGGCQFLRKRLISWQCKKQTIVANSTTKTEYVAAANCCRQIDDSKGWEMVNDQEQIQALVDNKKVIIIEDNIRSDLRFDDAEGTACLLNEAFFEGLARMGAKTTTWNEFSSTMAYAIICLADNQKFNFSKHKEMYIISSHTKKVFANMKSIGTGFSRKKQKHRRKQRKEAEISHDELEDEDHVPTSSDLLPSGRRVKPPMEKDSLGAQEDASKQGRMIVKIDQNAKIALDDETQGRTNDDEMFGVDDLAGEEVVMDTTTGEHEEQIIEDVSTAEPVTTAGEVVITTTVKDSAAPTTDVTEDEITMAQALAALRSTKSKVVVQEQEMSTIIPAAATTATNADKGKAKIIEPKVSIKKKDQMRIDEEYARKLEAEEQKAARLSRAQQDEEANKS
nr:uncharacterized mitochondrial protein AtMg00810-like [Tanacetum cinerariifolium]